MRVASRRHPLGFTLYEFAIVAGVLGALVGVLLLRTQFYQDEAEQVAVRQVVSSLRIALTLRAAEVGAKEGQRGLLRLVEENPLDWLAEKPRNYFGEYYSPELKEIPAGNWVFDRRDKCLIYLLKDHKSSSLSASNLLKFKVEFAQLPKENGKSRNRPAEATTGVVLSQVNGLAFAPTDQ
jgi:type II secretory pathway pseudopilin PulG